jgi:hypothetical protein
LDEKFNTLNIRYLDEDVIFSGRVMKIILIMIFISDLNENEPYPTSDFQIDTNTKETVLLYRLDIYDEFYDERNCRY